jgi:hypothetical protein
LSDALVSGTGPKDGSTLYNALNGQHFKEEWNAEFYHNLANGSHQTHCLGVEVTTQCK